MSMQGMCFSGCPRTVTHVSRKLETVRQFEMEMVSPSEVTREHSAVNKIKSAILDHGNPFAVEGDRPHNMITHACVPDEFVEQILYVNDTGQKMYEDNVINDISLWTKVTKVGNKIFMSGNKTTPITLRNKTVYLKETKDLYGRLMIFAKSETLEIMNLPLPRDHCFPRMIQCYDAQTMLR